MFGPGWIVAPNAACAEDDRVLVLMLEESPLYLRLQAELADLGLTPVPLRVDTPPMFEEMARLGRENRSSLTLWVWRHGRGGDVRLVDRVTGKDLRRAVVIDTQTADPDALIALSAVELLHASLLELQANRTPRGDVPITPTFRKLAGKPAPNTPDSGYARWSLSLGTGLNGSPGQAGRALHVAIGAHVHVRPHFGLGLAVYAPVLPGSIAQRSGTASVWPTLLWFGARVPLRRDAQATWLPHLGFGVVAARLTTRGQANQPGYEARTSRGGALGPALEAGLGAAVTQRLRLQAQIGVAYLSPRLEVAFAERVVAAFGRPLVFGTFGLQLAL